MPFVESSAQPYEVWRLKRASIVREKRLSIAMSRGIEAVTAAAAAWTRSSLSTRKRAASDPLRQLQQH